MYCCFDLVTLTVEFNILRSFILTKILKGQSCFTNSLCFISTFKSIFFKFVFLTFVKDYVLKSLHLRPLLISHTLFNGLTCEARRERIWEGMSSWQHTCRWGSKILKDEANWWPLKVIWTESRREGPYDSMSGNDMQYVSKDEFDLNFKFSNAT